MLQSQVIFHWLKFSVILGNDIAVEVAEVGRDVTQFKKFDRVIAPAEGSDAGGNSHGEFQDYIVIEPGLAASIPDPMSYADAVVFPLVLATAASGLYQKDYLGLQHPSIEMTPTGKTILV